MKDRNEIGLDFIGEQNSLTKEEEKALSDYFKQKKASLKLTEIIKPIRKMNSKTLTK